MSQEDIKPIYPALSTQPVPIDRLPDAETMSLDEARVILQTVVDSHEQNFDANSSLSHIARYSVDVLRKAVYLVAMDITVDNEDDSLNPRIAVKNTPHGKLTMKIHNTFDKNLTTTSPQDCALSLENMGLDVLYNDFLINQPTGNIDRAAVGFIDYREDVKAVSLIDMDEEPFVEGYQHMLRGLRWMCVNLLEWKTNPGVVMPEDLDGKTPNALLG